MNNINWDIEFLEKSCVHEENGLPQDIFHFFSRHIPIANVDLLIKDADKNTLLAWRNDKFGGTGWHIPGGVIKYKEKIDECINRTSLREIGTKVVIDSHTPITIVEMFKEHQTRGHFIALLFRCYLTGNYLLPNQTPNTEDCLKWFDKCPDNLIPIHECYRKYI